jgi:probable HAF family extracellular repeat protein
MTTRSAPALTAMSLLVIAGAAGSAFAQGSFRSLGPLSQPFGVNDDGATIVGRTPSVNPNAYDEACRWSGGVHAGLGFVPGTDDSVAFAASGNGGVIVGASGEFTFDYGVAFKYSNGQMQSLGRLAGGIDYSIANGVSQDGNVIVGEGDDGVYFVRAWRKVGNGPLQPMGPLPGGTECWAMDANSDGSVICGSGYDGADMMRAFRWTAATNMVALPLPTDGEESQGFGVSENGAVIVGAAYLLDFTEVPCRWTTTGTSSTVQALPVPVTHQGGVAYATNSDGSVVVGNLWLDGIFPEAMIWTSAGGTRLLQEALTAAGAVIPQDWILTHAWDVSPDGRVIVGTAVDGDGETQGFAATLFGSPIGGGGCSTADFDGDGDSATDADIEAFFACLAGNCCSTCWSGGADFNGDGDAATDADIEAFFRVLSGNPC